jgi:hypothetical protein
MADDPDSEAIREQLAAQFGLLLSDKNTIQDARSAVQRNLDDVGVNRALKLLRRYPGKRLSFRVSPVCISGDQGATYMAYRFVAANRMAERIIRVVNIGHADDLFVSGSRLMEIIHKAIANDDVRSMSYLDRNRQPIPETSTPGEIPEEIQGIKLNVQGSRVNGVLLRAADAPRKSITFITGIDTIISGGLAAAFRNVVYRQRPLKNYSIFKWPVPHAAVHAYNAVTNISLPLGPVFGAVAGVLAVATAYNGAILIRNNRRARRMHRGQQL